MGGNACEPALIKGGKVYTLGCGDPHPVTGIELVTPLGFVESDGHGFNGPPATPAEAKRINDEWQKENARKIASGEMRPGYRRIEP